MAVITSMPMNRALSPWITLLFVLFLSPLALFGDSKTKPTSSDLFVFQWLPNSLSRNPRLEMSVITEMTELGKRLPQASRQEPQYFLATSGGYRALGMSAPGNEKSPPPEELEKMMYGALARSGFLPADDKHVAKLALVYHWGSYSSAAQAVDDMDVPMSELLMIRELLERAGIVGGTRFASDFLKALEDEADYRRATAPKMDSTGTVEVIPSVAGDLADKMLSATSPMHRFVQRDDITRRLVDMAYGSCYYVIASAYDASALAQGRHRLLWRTKMSVLADGVSLTQTVRPMIFHAGDYFGRNMDAAVTLSRRVREGKVEIGEASVIGVEELASKTPKAK